MASGCDSNDDGPTDAERFAGTWTFARVVDSKGDQSTEFAALVSSLTVVFQAGDGEADFSLDLDYKEDSGREDVDLSGKYALDEGARTITLGITLDAASVNVPFTYVFENDSRVMLSTQAVLINPIFNPTTPYEGTVTVTIQKQ